MTDTGIEFDNIDVFVTKLGPETFAQPARNFLGRVGVQGQNFARLKAPRDSGGLANAISYIVDSASFPQWVKIGASRRNAKPMEYGTGLLSDAPDSKHKRHFPPPDALRGWAEARGRNPWAVAIGIFQRGGLAKRPYLRPAFEQLRSVIPGLLDRMGREIEAQFLRR